MRRRVWTIVGAVILGFGGAGCGETDDPPAAIERASSTPNQLTTETGPADTPRDSPPATAPQAIPDEPESESDDTSPQLRLFERMDTEAVRLDEAIDAALDALSTGAAREEAERIRRISERMRDLVNDYLLAGNDTSVGANSLLSAAVSAREATLAGDQPRLVDQRREAQDARDLLAEEIIGG